MHSGGRGRQISNFEASLDCRVSSGQLGLHTENLSQKAKKKDFKRNTTDASHPDDKQGYLNILPTSIGFYTFQALCENVKKGSGMDISQAVLKHWGAAQDFMLGVTTGLFSAD